MARQGEHRGYRAHPRLLPRWTRRGGHSRHGAHHRLLGPVRVQAGQVRGEVAPDEPLATLRLPARRGVITRMRRLVSMQTHAVRKVEDSHTFFSYYSIQESFILDFLNRICIHN